MRRGFLVAGHPWTLMILLEEDPDSLGCLVQFRQMNLDGAIVDSWEQRYDTLDEALRHLEMSYGIGPEDWIELG